MSWQQKDVLMLRKEFVLLAQQEGSNISSLCKSFNITRPTGYKWIERYNEFGEAGLKNLSTRPLLSPNKTPEDIEKTIIDIRLKHPSWGARKIESILKKSPNRIKSPSASSITDILRRNGLISKNSKQNAPYIRFEHEAPNLLWQMDFKGHFKLSTGKYCYPLTILDDHSRFSLGIIACEKQTTEVVKNNIRDVFLRYGLPERINVDNGVPWACSHSKNKYTDFSVWLISLGVMVSFSRPYHPQTNGKIERFHRTLKNELINQRYLRDMNHAQQSFDEWRETYNLERPHEAIGMNAPISRYSKSYRELKDDYSKEFPYADEFQVHKVDNKGRIYIRKLGEFFIGRPFANKNIGLIPMRDKGFFDVYFCHQKIMNLPTN